jgi:hypothetical protein
MLAHLEAIEHLPHTPCDGVLPAQPTLGPRGRLAHRVQLALGGLESASRAREETLAAVRWLFTALLPAEMADLESLIALGQLAMPPPQAAKGGSAG